MGNKIVLKDDINQQINSMNSISINFDGYSDKIKTTLSNISNSFRRSGGKTTIVEACKNTISAIEDSSELLKEGQRLLITSRDTYQNLDVTLRKAFENADFQSVQSLSFGENVSAQNVYNSEEEYWDSLVNAQYVDYTVDPDGYYRRAINLNASEGWDAKDKMQCVGYAWARFGYLSGHYPNFSCGYAKSIGATYMNDPNLELINDINQIKIPSLAYGPSGDTGHVVCIEKVLVDSEGRHIVYYTAANEVPPDGTLFKFVYEENPTKFEGFVQLKSQ